jgi:hypothetical protein
MEPSENSSMISRARVRSRARKAGRVRSLERTTMIVAEPLGSAEDKSLELELGRNIKTLARGGAAFRQAESGDGETSAENLGNLLRQVSKTSMDEIDNLISELQTLRRKLQTDGDRIQLDITKYAELSEQVMQLTTIISDSVKKLPGAPSIS